MLSKTKCSYILIQQKKFFTFFSLCPPLLLLLIPSGSRPLGAVIGRHPPAEGSTHPGTLWPWEVTWEEPQLVSKQLLWKDSTALMDVGAHESVGAHQYDAHRELVDIPSFTKQKRGWELTFACLWIFFEELQAAGSRGRRSDIFLSGKWTSLRSHCSPRWNTAPRWPGSPELWAGCQFTGWMVSWQPSPSSAEIRAQYFTSQAWMHHQTVRLRSSGSVNAKRGRCLGRRDPTTPRVCSSSGRGRNPTGNGSFKG